MTKQPSYRVPRTDAARIAEAQSSVAALERTLSQGDNRFGTYGANVRDSIRRWQLVITEIEEKRRETGR